jgi:PAS domain S-box-containing protein
MFTDPDRIEYQLSALPNAPLPLALATSLESLDGHLDGFTANHCREAVFWIEPGGRVVQVNDPACRLLGYERGDLLQKRLPELFLAFSAEGWADHWQSLQQTDCIRLESELVARDGRRIPVDIVAHRVCFGAQAYCCAFAGDLTEKKQDERKSKVYEIRLALSQRMEALGTLAGGIAHDFNNILSAILGYAELSLDGLAKEAPQRDYLQEVLTAGTRARELVHQILSFSRQAERTVQPLQFKTIAKEALKLLRASIPSTIDIRTNIASDGLVMADAGQLHQIVMHLCTSAAQAMPPEGGIMHVSLESVPIDADNVAPHPGIEPGRYLRWMVSGLAKAGEPCETQSLVGARTPAKGTGLSVVRGIVSECAGYMFEENSGGKGTVVNVFLPLLERAKRAVAEPAEQLPMGTGQEHILVVDDEAAVARMVTMMLERMNYRVTGLTSSIEALALFKEKSDQFDLVITDLTMPNLPGPKLAAELNKIRPGIPIILCTGYGGEISETKVAKAGIQATIMKPIAKAELASSVRGLLDKAKAAA